MILNASSSVYCFGGYFMKYADGRYKMPLFALSGANLQHGITSITTPAQLGQL